jgi:hypothetical protein
MRNRALRILTHLRLFIVLAILLPASACGVYRMLTMDPPPAEEFGFGPRTSRNGMYVARIESPAPLVTGRMQKIELRVTDKASHATENAVISVDGGMPQHGHGLPTAPRVTRSLGDGRYQVDGLKFNMGGWWEVRFRITSPAGTDSVTFNVKL